MCNLLTKDDVSSRLRVVLSFKERWTDWHQTAAHTTTSSQSQYPTVTRTETSTSNRSVIWSPRSLGALVNYWHHYVAMCNGELWISAQIKTFILQTVPFKLHQQLRPNHKSCLQLMKCCCTSSRSAQNPLQTGCQAKAKCLFSHEKWFTHTNEELNSVCKVVSP